MNEVHVCNPTVTEDCFFKFYPCGSVTASWDPNLVKEKEKKPVVVMSPGYIICPGIHKFPERGHFNVWCI